MYLARVLALIALLPMLFYCIENMQTFIKVYLFAFVVAISLKVTSYNDVILENFSLFFDVHSISYVLTGVMLDTLVYTLFYLGVVYLWDILILNKKRYV